MDNLKENPAKEKRAGLEGLWVVASMKRTHFGFSQAAVNVLWRCRANLEVKLGTNAPRFGINSPCRSGLLPTIYPYDEAGQPRASTFRTMRDQDLTCQNCGPSSSLRLHAQFPEVNDLPELRCLECVTCGEVVLVERVTSIAQPHVTYWRERGY
jgi:hypothetical protein